MKTIEELLCEKWSDITALSLCVCTRVCVCVRVNMLQFSSAIYPKKGECQWFYQRLITSWPPECCRSNQDVFCPSTCPDENESYWEVQTGGRHRDSWNPLILLASYIFHITESKKQKKARSFLHFWPCFPTWELLLSVICRIYVLSQHARYYLDWMNHKQ